MTKLNNVCQQNNYLFITITYAQDSTGITNNTEAMFKLNLNGWKKNQLSIFPQVVIRHLQCHLIQS